MSEKKALLFDTNFIIQNRNLDEVVENLSTEYSVYVTQVSIDERIAQECRDLQKRYDEAKQWKKEYALFAKIEFTKSFSEVCELYHMGMQEKYERLFPDNIIPLEKSVELLEMVLDRANNKLPPFSEAKDASDKGFKDCLLWLSVLNYFRSSGEDEVVFLTNDKSAFRGKDIYLSKEFNAETGKTIVFMPNSFYHDILSAQTSVDDVVEVTDSVPNIPNLDALRDEISEVMRGLCGFECEGSYGEPEWTRTFSSSVMFDKEYMENVFSNLSSIIYRHILEKSIYASEALGLDGRISDDVPIPMNNLEAALKLYQEIKTKYSDYCDQFFEAAARVLNRNYVEPSVWADDGRLPF